MSSEPSGGDDFSRIAEQCRPMLRVVAIKLCGDDEMAKDLVQETLLRGLRHFDRFQPGTNAATWLATILTHLFYDHLKHRKVVRNAEPDLVVPEAVESAPTLASITDAELYAAIGQLEPELREVIEVCYLKQRKYHEAAEILNLRPGTVGTRLMRARERLRELLRAGPK
jgi:RNA polymerase sigma-70 factor (ECF subfamily)